jgi:tetratricopeptide (TPR) repeat protein
MADPAIGPEREQSLAPGIRPTVPVHPDSSPRPLSPVVRLAPPLGEQALLKTALRSLRTAHDPASALAALDDYRARFPSGALAPEAAMLRAEALLQTGRKGEALAELDRLSLAEMPNSDERYLLRGELRAAAGRWREAQGDFDVVLHGPKTDSGATAKSRDHFERALWGRALARSHLGDDAGARADLQECLRRFPRGRFAFEAARLLGEHR